MNEIPTTTHSIESERAVLGALMVDPNVIDRIGALRGEHFYQHGHRLIFETITGLAAAAQPVDAVTVFERLQATGRGEQAGGLVYLTEMAQSTPSSANVGRYADIVRDRAMKRSLLVAAGDIQSLVAEESGKPAAATLDAAQAILGRLADQTAQQEAASISEAAGRYIEDLDERYHGSSAHPGIKTGLADLDDLLNGGLRRGTLITLGARPGMGKSALAETIACNVSTNDAGNTVLFLSQEMPESEVTERALAIWGSVPVTALSAGTAPALKEEHWAGITHACTVAGCARLHIDDEANLTLLDVVAKARAMKRKNGLDLLVVDYLQLMAGSEDSRNAQLQAITQGLKVLAKSLDIVVLALSQFSRDIERRGDKRPKKSDFKDAGSIEQDSDVLLGLYREEEDDPDTQWKGMAELYVMKHRRGRKGRICLTYQGEYMRFRGYAGIAPAEDRPAASSGRKREAFA